MTKRMVDMNRVPTQTPTVSGRAFHRLAAIFFLAVTILAAPAQAARLSGDGFAPRIDSAASPLELCTSGTVRRLFMKALSAGLYLDRCSTPERALEDGSKALEILYFWSIGAKDFADAADAVLARTFAAAELAQLRPRIDQLHRAYRDVRPGDRYRLTYVPDEGLTLTLNGDPLVTVPGADFARAYFAIWLGPRPADEGLRADLLARDAFGDERAQR